MKEKRKQGTTPACTRRLLQAPSPRHAQENSPRPRGVPAGPRARYRSRHGLQDFKKRLKVDVPDAFGQQRSSRSRPWGTHGVTVSPVISFHSFPLG